MQQAHLANNAHRFFHDRVQALGYTQVQWTLQGGFEANEKQTVGRLARFGENMLGPCLPMHVISNYYRNRSLPFPIYCDADHRCHPSARSYNGHV
jgi:hypothetical protein